ncbi:hypothetical protein ED236_09045 [Pseudomethylobacillus aquaticus]|uniref:Bacterial sugar transferase domain-containing protein n=1 Tax=Pseudomethylobacillus aquaticus TaxID=2676064 RepID=A0A3N0V049_9PROT|nr:sugar transferase [Pseudomethylobacillus aquaticus]ROH85868.1 hypothetical protein ED236_09045 [Pseudomethylobacillus aquaticus]
MSLYSTRFNPFALPTRTIAQYLLEPLVWLLVLFVISAYTGASADGRHVALFLLTLLLTFPGCRPHGSSAGFLGQVVASTLRIVVLLSLVGCLTSSLDLLSPSALLLWWLLSPLLVFVLGLGLEAMMRKHPSKARRAVLVGGTKQAQKFIDTLAAQPELAVMVLGFFDDREAQRLEVQDTGAVLGNLSQISAYCQQHGVDDIYIALPMIAEPRIIKLLDELREVRSSIYFLPDAFIHDLMQTRIDVLGGMPLLAMSLTPMQGLQALIKRVSDSMLAAVLLVLSLPVLLLLAVVIRLGSHGSVIVCHRMHHLDGRALTVYRLRTRNISTEEMIQARTPIGDFLTCSGLEWLPALYNVVRGDMALAGPRPYPAEQQELYHKHLKTYLLRYPVRSGIFSWAGSNGSVSEPEKSEDIERRLASDMDYLRNWSLWLDMWIVLRGLLRLPRSRHDWL